MLELMASIAGFAIGSALASDLDAPERMRLGLVGALMPSPLVGALVVAGLIEGEQSDETTLERAELAIQNALRAGRDYDERETRERFAEALEELLAEVRQQPDNF